MLLAFASEQTLNKPKLMGGSFEAPPHHIRSPLLVQLVLHELPSFAKLYLLVELANFPLQVQPMRQVLHGIQEVK